jgi:protein SCO1
MARPPPDFVPPPWLRFIRKYVWVLAFLLGAVTLTVMRPMLRHIPEPPPVLYSLPDDYALVDHLGRPFTPSTLEGEVWVAGFVFTSCPSSCPAVTRAMSDLADRFDRNKVDVKIVSFTVDPERDTPEVLAAYAEQAGADPARWRFVTGEPDAIRSLVSDGFRLGVGDRQAVAGDGGDLYDIAHSTKLALVDGEGQIRGYYGIEPDLGLAEIYERADRVLQEQRSR